jgi:hypothetical protein
MKNIENIVNKLSVYVKAIFRATSIDSIEFIGCGFLLKEGDNIFLITAAHVFDYNNNNSSPLYTYNHNGKFIPIQGKAITNQTAQPKHRKDDDDDLAVIWLNKDATAAFQKTPALGLNDLDLNFEANHEYGYIVIGYPRSTNKKSIDCNSKFVDPIIYGFKSSEKTDSFYNTHDIKKDSHIAIHFNKKEVYSDTQKKTTAPDLNGMSGTPIWGFTGCSEKIVAILTDHVTREKKVVLGRRVNDIRSWLNDLLNAD